MTVREKRALILVQAVLEWLRRHDLGPVGKLSSWHQEDLRRAILEILP